MNNEVKPHKYLHRIFVFLLVTLVLKVSCSSKMDHAEIAQRKAIEKIDSLMHYVSSNDMFNGSAHVIMSGRSVYSNSLGYVDGSKESILTNQSLYSIGSVSKEFHAVSIMQLVERRLLSLDDRLSSFGLDLPPWSEDITVEHLLNNASGLPQLNFKTVKSEADLFDDLQSLDTLQSLPGSAYLYNHNIPILLKKIIEIESGISFKQYVKDNILTKCDISVAVFDATSDDPNYVYSFNEQFENDELYNPFDGWLFLNIEDLKNWIVCLQNNKVINQESLAELLDNQYFDDKPSFLGQTSPTDDGGIKRNRVGGFYNYITVIQSDISADDHIILLSNNGWGYIGQITSAIDSIIQDRPFSLPMKKNE